MYERELGNIAKLKYLISWLENYWCKKIASNQGEESGGYRDEWGPDEAL